MCHTSKGITCCNNACLGLCSADATTQDDRHCRQLDKTLLLTYTKTPTVRIINRKAINTEKKDNA